MKIYRIVLGLLAVVLMGTSVRAQEVLDGAYIKEHTVTRKVIQYAHLREADVMWTKRIWRVIDLHEKINHPLYYPDRPIKDRKSLFQVIKKGVLEDGSMTAYDAGVFKDQDEFTESMTKNQLEDVFIQIDTVMVEDLDTGDFIEKIQKTEVESSAVKQYKIKEDWFFERQRSVMEVRIIGIAPMKEEFNESGEFLGYAEMFWLYFPECRYVFVNHEVFNRFNGAERRTFDDVFQKRMFNSYIVKQENVYDRAIVDHKQGLDALIEADKVKDHLFRMEHDLWSF